MLFNRALVTRDCPITESNDVISVLVCPNEAQILPSYVCHFEPLHSFGAGAGAGVYPSYSPAVQTFYRSPVVRRARAPARTRKSRTSKAVPVLDPTNPQSGVNSAAGLNFARNKSNK